MYRSRVIPCLLLKNKGLYKTIKFKNPKYLGDPINTLRLFNGKEVDEVIVLDIAASINGGAPDLNYLKRLAGECFMPICYGGGVSTLKQVEDLYKIGIEKVSFNTVLYSKPDLIEEASKNFGAQSIVASIDFKKKLMGGYSVFVEGGTKDLKINPVEYAKKVEDLGVGEILINAIDHDGMMSGYDYNIIEKVSVSVSVPVIACGGAGSLKDCVDAVKSGASAAAAGSLFVYYGLKKAVLINYPTQVELEESFNQNL